MKYQTILILALLLPLGLSAQRIKKVCGEYTYYAEGHESPLEAKAKALEKAKLKALEKEFGSVISQSTTISETADDGEEHSFFSQLSEAEVKGEWIEDIGDPEYNISLNADGEIVVTCRICGHAREFSNKAAEFEAKVLRNHPELKDAEVHFKSGEYIYMYFSAPCDGYVAIYLIDEAQTASCLLPYLGDMDGQQKVKGGKEYFFFSEAKAEKEHEIVEYYNLFCANNVIERNKIYVIFSKNPFTKAVDHRVKEKLPRQLSYTDFQHWLGRLRAHDPEMGVKSMRIEIRP